MLKIYWRHTKYELHNNDNVISLHRPCRLVIMDENDAVAGSIEFGAYTEDAEKAYYPDCELQKKNKGIRAIYWTYDGPVHVKQWIAPNAKLIVHRSYSETSCSMKSLMDLPAPDVIAYLKQEGLSVALSS